MKLKLLAVCGFASILFIQCDPTKKIYSSEEYMGDIDTSYTGYEDYEYGDYEDTDYYDDYTSYDTVISPYSPEIYRGTEKRTNDLIHTKLEVSFDWKKAWMYGKATLTLKPYFYPTSELTLDAKGFEIKEISMVTATGKTPLTYLYNTDTIPDTLQININLGKTFSRNEEYTIFIDYIAKPNTLTVGGSAAISSDKGLYFINNEGLEKDKPMQIWTQGETEATSCWCPTIDKPNERCTDEISITIEDKYQTLSNGVLVSSKKNTDGTRTDYWKMDLPHAPYLFMMAIGEYSIVKDNWKGMPVNYYVEKDYEQYARAIFGNTPEMIEFFSNKLGVKYAWPKYSQVIVRDYVSGAMENTTATVLGEFLQQTARELLDESNEDVISHELFHQWFGDLVTCESWSNIPLNESFATYGEYLWREYKYGRDDADQLAQSDLSTYLDEASYKQVDLIRFNYDTREDMFDSHSYAKGGRVLHMLRKYLGDDAFFAGLNKYLNDNKFNSVEIENLRLAMEAVSGEDLHWFFDEWFLNSGHPSLDIYSQYDAENKLISINIDQLQDTATAPIYTLPMDIDIYANGKVERHRIIMDRASQVFTFNSDVQPDLVNVDAEKMLLCYKTDNKSVPEYIFQYQHAPLYLDRYESVEWLSIDQFSDTTARALMESALNDKHWSIRQFVLDTLLIDASTSTEVKNKIVDMATHDPKSYVRGSALRRLSDLAGINQEEILLNALKDSSYSVISNAMIALYELDPAKGVEQARKFMHEDNFSIKYTVLSILGNEGVATDNDFFLSKLSESSGYEAYYVMIYYEPFLQRMNDFYVIQKGVDELKKIALDEENFWMSYSAQTILTGLVTTYETNMETADEFTKKQYQLSIDYINKIIEEINAGADY